MYIIYTLYPSYKLNIFPVIGTNSTFFQLSVQTQHFSSYWQSIYMIQNLSGSYQYGAVAYLKMNSKYAHLNGVEK